MSDEFRSRFADMKTQAEAKRIENERKAAEALQRAEERASELSARREQAKNIAIEVLKAAQEGLGQDRGAKIEISQHQQFDQIEFRLRGKQLVIKVSNQELVVTPTGVNLAKRAMELPGDVNKLTKTIEDTVLAFSHEALAAI